MHLLRSPFEWNKRTRFMCHLCKIPLCTPGTGKTTRDCFAISHNNPTILDILKERFNKQNNYTTKRYRLSNTNMSKYSRKS